MTPTQAENLRILIRHMETNVSRTLDMDRIANVCGTPACAMGEACMVPSLGLSFPVGESFSLSLNGVSIDLASAARRVFGLEYHGLFGASLNNNDTPTPGEWAAEARKVLAEHGYSMDDGFAAFKAKVLAPIDIESVSTAHGIALWPSVL